jgi:beta-lactamase superfamily II metal-dependent hydrolase
MVDGTVSYLFEGDASSAVEKQMDSEFGSAMNVDTLKVGHHGSSSDSSTSFLTDTSPAVAVIEVGAGNDIGLPTQQTLDRLSTEGAQVYRTDLNGTVTITTDESAWMIYTAQ